MERYAILLLLNLPYITGLTCHFCMVTRPYMSSNAANVVLTRSNGSSLTLHKSEIDDEYNVLRKDFNCLYNNEVWNQDTKYTLSENETMTISCSDFYVNGVSGQLNKTFTCNKTYWNSKPKKNMWRYRKAEFRPWCTERGKLERITDIWRSQYQGDRSAIQYAYYLHQYDVPVQYNTSGLTTSWILQFSDGEQNFRNATILYDASKINGAHEDIERSTLVMLDCGDITCLTYKSYKDYNITTLLDDLEYKAYNVSTIRYNLCDNKRFEEHVFTCPKSSQVALSSPQHVCRVKYCDDSWHCEDQSDLEDSSCTKKTCSVNKPEFNKTIELWEDNECGKAEGCYNEVESCEGIGRLFCVNSDVSDVTTVDFTTVDFTRVCDNRNDCAWAGSDWSADEAVCISVTQIFTYSNAANIVSITSEQLCSWTLFEKIRAAMKGQIDENKLITDISKDYNETCSDVYQDLFNNPEVLTRICGSMFPKECSLITTRYRASSTQFDWNTVLRSAFECSVNEVIPLYLVCNGVKDCLTAEDEMYCSNRQMCGTSWESDQDLLKPIVSYTEREKCDRIRQCGNGRDECYANCLYDAFSDGTRMITSIGLAAWLFILGFLAIILNISMICVIILKAKRESGLKILNRWFLFNIAVGGLLMGCYLMIIMGKYLETSTGNNGTDCWDDKKWAASNNCVIAGVINSISLTVSLSSLCVLSLLRCYVVCIGLRSMDFSIWKVIAIGIVGTLLIWIPSVVFALLPLSADMEDIFVKSRFHQYNEWFYGDGSKARYKAILAGLSNNTNITSRDDLTWKEIDRNISARLYVNGNEKVIGTPISYYSDSALCVPSFLPPLELYTLIILIYFLILCVVQIAAYSTVLVKARWSRQGTDNKDKHNKDQKTLATLVREAQEKRLQNNIVLMCLTTVLTIGLISLVTIIVSIVDGSGQHSTEITQTFYAVLVCTVLPINSVLNPLIYSAKDMPIERIRKYIRKKYRAFRKSRRFSNMSSTQASSPVTHGSIIGLGHRSPVVKNGDRIGDRNGDFKALNNDVFSPVLQVVDVDNEDKL